MVENKRDLASLIEFLDYASDHGYLNAKTAKNRRSAARSVFGAVKNADISDVTSLDIDDVLRRYEVLVQSKAAVSTVRTHGIHLRGAIRDFQSYVSDPVNYKPASRGRTTTATKAAKKTVSNKPSVQRQTPGVVKPTPAEAPSNPVGNSGMPSLHIDIQVHISPQSSDTQIDKVFESMAKHLRDLYQTTK